MDISLALGAGGAKGNSHIGVLRQLEKHKFRVRAIAGTSFGGVVGAVYAAGYSIDELEEIFAAWINIIYTDTALRIMLHCMVWRVLSNG